MPVVQSGYLVPPDVAEGYGFQERIGLPNPPAGGSNLYRVPGSRFVVPLNITCSLTTSATVSNRNLLVGIDDSDGARLDNIYSNITVAASNSGSYRFTNALSAPFSPLAGQSSSPLASFILPSGWAIHITCLNLQVGDQIGQQFIILNYYDTGIQPERFRDLGPYEVSKQGVVLQPSVGPVAPAPTVSSPTVTAPAPTPAPAPATTTTTTTDTSSTELGSGSSAGSGGPVSRL